MTQQKSPDDMQLQMYHMMERMGAHIVAMEARMEEHMARMEENMATRQDIDRIMNILDTHTGMLETDETERLAMGAQVSRHQDWIERADKVLKIKTA